jgi:hypothetical protein
MAKTNTQKKIKAEAEDVAVNSVPSTAVPLDDINRKLDRIIELLEGTLVTKNQGFNLQDNPWLDRMLSKI